MTLEQIKRRLAALELQVARLSNAKGTRSKPRWVDSVGMFTGDETMKEIVRLGQKWREKDREQARKKRK